MIRIPTWAGVRRRLFRGRVTLANLLLDSAEKDRLATGSAAEFGRWLARRRGGRFTGYPTEWIPRIAEISRVGRPRIAVVLHVHYPDLVDDILRRLEALPCDFDLVVTDSSGAREAIDGSRLPGLQSLISLPVENRGRDILPTVYLVNSGLLDDYDIVLKLHTKKSPWRDAHGSLDGSGGDWRERLLDSVLPGPDQVASILRAFADDVDLGVVAQRTSIVGAEHWGGNQQATEALLRRVELGLPDSLEFASGSIYWMRGSVLRGLRALRLERDDFEPERGQDDGTTAHAVERVLGILAQEAGYSIRSVDGAQTNLDAVNAVTAGAACAQIVPFYLPQYHAFPENDRWWGKGFTEWANVTKAAPNYLGHQQPLLPGSLGFYDLNRDEVRAEQSRLGERAGIAAFMYYYYWFAGRRLMDMPITRLLASDSTQPVCIMWANEDWTRTWDGRTSDVLMGQDYDVYPAEEFLDDVQPLMRDPRYFRVDGRPVLAVYRPGNVPDFGRVLAAWRDSAREAGLGELYVLGVDVGEVFEGMSAETSKAVGLDGLLGFPPHNNRWEWLSRSGLQVSSDYRGRLLSYRSMADAAIEAMAAPVDGGVLHPGVMVGFDNTARRQHTADIWYGSNPFTFRRWLRAAVRSAERSDGNPPLVFVNAWNEWAEGAVLEPTERYGALYLDAVRSVQRSDSRAFPVD